MRGARGGGGVTEEEATPRKAGSEAPGVRSRHVTGRAGGGGGGLGCHGKCGRPDARSTVLDFDLGFRSILQSLGYSFLHADPEEGPDIFVWTLARGLLKAQDNTGQAQQVRDSCRFQFPPSELL